MKIIIFLFLLLLIPPRVFAEVKVSVSGDSNVSVDQTVEGTSTTCINGECTTRGGESKSKVCVNGECYESGGEDINVEKDNGNVKININNSNSKLSATVKTQTKEVAEKNAEDVEDKEIKNPIKEESEDAKKYGVVEKIISQISSILDNILSIF